jgi:N-acetyltransferase
MNFDLQPTLTGELVELRPLRPEDFDALFAAAGDPLIWEQHPESDRYTREVFQRYFDGAIASRGAFVVIERATGRVIGSTRYHDLSESGLGQVEIGFTFLERKFWGGAYNGEMKSLLLDHAFRFVNRVVFVVGVNNLRSQKALEKIGARFSHRVERRNRDGSVQPNLVFAIEKRHWKPAAAAAPAATGE